MTTYIIFSKNGPGQQVTTVADAHGSPVLRDEEWIDNNVVSVLETEDDVFTALDLASGTLYAIQPELARTTLGWDV